VLSAEIAAEAWEMMDDLGCFPPSPQFRHYLWALVFMKLFPPSDMALHLHWGGAIPKQSISTFGLTSIQYSNWMVRWFFPEIVLLHSLHTHITFAFLLKIQFENRKRGDAGNDCLLSVDSTDFRIAKTYVKPFNSFKF
jgi:hypothetical protein